MQIRSMTSRMGFFRSMIVMTLVGAAPFSSAWAEELVIDAVAASVNGQPITLQDIASRLPTAEAPKNLAELAVSGSGMRVLDGIIMERVLTAEAETRRVQASEEEIERYIGEIAARNQLSAEGLQEVLNKEGRTLDQYKEQVRLDIIRTKLASNYVKNSSAVTEKEVEQYIKEHPELQESGTRLKLRRILISTVEHTEEEARIKLEALRSSEMTAEEFSELAEQHSEGPEAAAGGSLGLVAEKDLSPEIFDLVLSLEPGSVSEVFTNSQGAQIFFLEERHTVDEDGIAESLKDEIKRSLQNQKFDSKLQAFFTTEIFKNYTIERKV